MSSAATTDESPKLSPINNAAKVNSNCFTVCTLNIYSLLNSLHYTAVADIAVDHNIDLIALTETWIKPTSTPAQLGYATPPGYSLYSKPRPTPENGDKGGILGGGLGFLVKDHYTVLSLTPCCYDSFECLSITVKLHSGNITIYSVYRPPSTSSYATTFSKFLNDFESFLTVAAVSPHNFLITGDFNIHVDKSTDANRTKFYSVLDAFNLMQLVSVPTHKDHNTLDLVIVPSDSTLVTDLTVLPVAPSDHFPILSYLKLMTTPCTPTCHTLYSLCQYY